MKNLILLPFFYIFIQPIAFSQLAGTYTIGGASPDFGTFTEAVDTLMATGVSGGVVFEVRDGVYEERISFAGPISGADSLNTITFQSESGDSTAVVLTQTAANSTENYTIQFNGCSWISFQGMTLQATGTLYAWVLYFAGNTSHIDIKNSTLRGFTLSSSYTSSNLSVIRFSGSNNEFILIEGNIFSDGTYGIYDNTGSIDTGIVVRDNRFLNQVVAGIYMNRMESPVIQGNIISTQFTNSGYQGIRLLDVTLGCIISENQIYGLSEGRGMDLDLAGAPNLPCIIANNFIHVGGSTNNPVEGIYIRGGSYQYFYYNTVNLTNDYPTSTCLYSSSGSNRHFLNNLFSNSGGGLAFQVTSAGSIVSSDYNNLYSSGPVLLSWAGTDYATLADWQAANSFESNSLSVNPMFIADTSYQFIQFLLDEAGTPIAEVQQDIEGDLRSTVAPDIGCDEFAPSYANDAGIVEILSPSKDEPFAVGSQPVAAVLRNNGVDTINAVTIGWLANGIGQAGYSWTGIMHPGQLDTVTIGNYDFALGQSYELNIYTSDPDGMADPAPFNDTLAVSNLYAGIEGTYTLGGFQPDFSSLNAVAIVLNEGGVLGPVNIKIRNGAYAERVLLKNINGADSANTVTFQSESGDSSKVNLSLYNLALADNYIIRLDGAAHVTFEKLTFQPLNPNQSTIFDLLSDASNIRILNCRLSAPAGSSDALLFASQDARKDSIEVRNCRIENGYHGIYLIGESPANLSSGTVIENNVFANQFIAAIRAERQDAPVIHSNRISTNLNNASYYGILCAVCDNGLSVQKNRISGGVGYGMYLSECDGTNGSRGLVANNFIQSGGDNERYSLYLSGNDFIDVFHNSVNNTSSSTLSAALRSVGGSEVNLVNNVFSNPGGGYAIRVNNGAAISNSDYNGFYTSGPVLGIWDGAPVNDLAGWQSASSMDAHTVFADPFFNSPADLHAAQSSLDSSGLFLSLIPTDIDGENRNLDFPDIGADEFDIAPIDLGVASLVAPASGCALDSMENVTVRIKNYGSLPQSGFDVGFILDGGTPVVENVGALSIPPGGAADYTFTQAVDLSSITQYNIKAFTSMLTDGLPANDSIPNGGATVAYYPPVMATLTEDQAICEGDFIALQVVGGSSYSWSNGAQGGITFVYPVSDSTFYVTITDNNGCAKVDSVTVTVFPTASTPTITADGPTTFCFGDSVQLASSVATSIEWTTGDITATITARLGGNYAVTHIDPVNGCNATSGPVTVNVIQEGIEADGFTEICASDTVTLTATDAVTAAWSTGEMTAGIEVSPNVTTAYYLTATSSEGCIYMDSITIQVLPNVPPSVPSMLQPVNNSINLQVPYNFSWQPANNATVYDLYVWPKDSIRPAVPTVNNTASINRTLTSLNLNADYTWQVAAVNSCYETFSDTLQFRTAGKPDLRVDTVIVPSSTTHGQSITVTWTVTNYGSSSTGSQAWFDNIWLSPDLNFEDGEPLLGRFQNQTYLHPGESYTQTRTVQLPQDRIGNFFIGVVADNLTSYCCDPYVPCTLEATRCRTGDNNIFELDEQNNLGIDTINIFPGPSPDFQVVSVGAPTAIFTGDEITVTYTVQNKGDAVYSGARWTDRVYISTDTFLDLDNALQLNVYPLNDEGELTAPAGGSGSGGALGSAPPGGGVFSPSRWFPFGGLAVDSSLDRSVRARIPDNWPAGTYNIHVLTDARDVVFELFNENNNSNSPILSGGSSMDITLTPPPDFQVTNVTTPPNAQSGQRIPFNWTVTNAGASDPPEFSWHDSLFISTVDTFDYINSIPIARINSGRGTFPAGESYTKNMNLLLPNGIAGDYYFFVKTDAGNTVYEYTFENNNQGRSPSTFHISLAPSPDLQVAEVQAPYDTLYEDSVFAFSWAIENAGDTVAKPSWRDAIYVSPDTIWNPQNAYRMASVFQNAALNVGASYSKTINMVVPGNLNGLHYFHVLTDLENTVYEHQAEDNNAGYSPAGVVFIPSSVSNPPIPPGEAYSDIQIDTLYAPDMASSGNSIQVYWAVVNQGPLETAATSWFDAIYLSADTILDGTDQLLGRRQRLETLGVSETYTRAQAVTIPNGISGDHYLIVELDDAQSMIGDTVRANNVGFVPIHINLTPPPDLTVANWNPPASAIAGQLIAVSYTADNIGPGNVPSGSKWYDQLYLSNTPDLSGTRWLIGSRTQTRALPAGGSYTDTLRGSIPAFAQGNYYLVLALDNGYFFKVYEYDQEGNNQAAALTEVIPFSVAAGDLVVTAVETPAQVTLGDTDTITYTVKNIGTNPISSVLYDRAFFAETQLLNTASDHLFSTGINEVSLMQGDSATLSLQGRAEGIEEGSYYGILRINAPGSVPESNIANNDRAAANQTQIVVEALALNAVDSNILSTFKPVYYKVTVGAGLDLLLTLASDQTGTVYNEMYVAYERLPAANDYDFRHTTDGQPNLTVLAPETQAGTYYILIKTQRIAEQSVATLAQALPFSLLSITPDEVGQGGVTTVLRGAGFRDGMEVWLEDGMGSVVATATLSDFRSSMEVELKWKLDSVAVGSYDVVARSLTDTISMIDKLSVVNTINSSIGIFADYPEVVHVGKQAVVNVNFVNLGNIDLDFITVRIGLLKETNLININSIGENIIDLNKTFGNSDSSSAPNEVSNRFKSRTFIKKGLIPGENFNIKLALKNFEFSVNPFIVVTSTATKSEYLINQILNIEV